MCLSKDVVLSNTKKKINYGNYKNSNAILINIQNKIIINAVTHTAGNIDYYKGILQIPISAYGAQMCTYFEDN